MILPDSGLAMGKRGELIEVMALRLPEGIIVTLGAFHPRAEKHAHRIGKVVQRHSPITSIVADCSSAWIPTVAGRSNELVSECIPRHVAGHRGTNPVSVWLVSRSGPHAPVGDPQQIEGPIRHVTGVAL